MTAMRLKLGKARIKRNGPSGFALAIPSVWIKNLGLKYGDEVEMTITSDGVLEVVPLLPAVEVHP